MNEETKALIEMLLVKHVQETEDKTEQAPRYFDTQEDVEKTVKALREEVAAHRALDDFQAFLRLSMGVIL